jgi:4-hydroxy-3-methylbut-2-enyl diphosphate reductase
MEVILGKTAGFCGGVRNSVNKACSILEEYKKVYCLGELVHNNIVINNLKDKGIIFVDDISDVPAGENVIFRAHGVTKEVYETAKNNNLTVFDLTCPKVLKIHDQIEEYIKNGYFVLLVGETKHPEVMGSLSYTNGNGLVIENIDDVDNKYDEYKDKEKIVLISQTTYSIPRFEEIANRMKKIISNIEINNTICNATSVRQEETKKIAKEVDLMIIIGGKKSSNTQKLYYIANEIVDSIIIETVNDLDVDLSKYKRIGVMAGASTPKESIDEVIDYINSL